MSKQIRAAEVALQEALDLFDPHDAPSAYESVRELLLIAQVKALIALAWGLEDLGRIQEDAAEREPR